MRNLSWKLFANPFYDATSPLWFDLDHTELKTATFSTYANGGFGEAQIEILEPSDNLIRKFIDGGLMKRITATDGAGRVAYEGFVGEIHAVIGRHTYVRSIDDFANRVYIQYKYSGGSGCPRGSTCTGKDRCDESDVASSTTQTEYGIKEAWLDITGSGNVNATIAADACNMALTRLLRARSIDFDLGDAAPRSNILLLTCWGYYATLQWRHFTRAYSTNTDIGTIVSEALAFEKSIVGHYAYGGIAPFISDDHSNIQTIGNTVKFNKEGKPIVLQDYIRGAMTAGDGDGREIYFQILEDRKPHLFPRSNNIRYYSAHDLSSVWNTQRKQIPLYMVRAGGHIVSESINSLTPINDVMNHERASIIETTTYDDISGKLSIPPPASAITPERIYARAIRRAHRDFK